MSSIKTLREKLCAAATGNEWPPDVRVAVNDLINLIDVHRPLGPDGKHDHRHTRTCGCEDGQLSGGPVGLTEEEQSRTSGPVADLDWNLFSKHQFQSSRKWPDGRDPVAPDWNPGCSCGESHHYFEHTRHLAEVVYKSEWLEAVKVAARKEALLAYAEVADGNHSAPLAGSWQDVAGDVRDWVENFGGDPRDGFAVPETRRDRLIKLVAQLKQSWDLNGDPAETEDFQAILDLLEGRPVPKQWWDQ